MQSEQINDLAASLVKAQGEIEGAAKNSTNPHFRSKYADLGAVWDACREPLTKNGLAVIQQPRAFEGEMRLVTRIIHSSGQWLEDDGCPLILGKNDMQGLGSAWTYARRYGLMAAVGIAPEDDDGNAAVGDGNGQKVKGGGRKAAPQNGDAEEKAKAFLTERLTDLAKCTSVNDIDDLGAEHEGWFKALKKYPEHWKTWTDAEQAARKRVAPNEEQAA